jgi:hypothetical protein
MSRQQQNQIEFMEAKLKMTGIRSEDDDLQAMRIDIEENAYLITNEEELIAQLPQKSLPIVRGIVSIKKLHSNRWLVHFNK